ncbi:MAG: DUF4249 family protein [Bacteroidales bacterium]|nr:DUF4249 family protein [Bacteroidales bacterium]
MKKRVILYIFFFLLSLTGCRKEFLIDNPTEGELCLVCYPGMRDTTIIQLYKTVPVGGRYEGSPYLQSANIAFSVDGVWQKVEQAAARVGTVPKGCWFVAEKVKNGAKVDISASVASETSVSASTNVPSMPPPFEYSITKDTWTDLTIEFDDDPATEDYYGVAVVCERTVISATGRKTETRHLSLAEDGYGTQEIAIIRDYYDAGFTGWSLWPQRTGLYGVRVWHDTKFNGKRASLSARFGPANFSIDAKQAQEIISIKVRLYKFTEEFYKYLTALDYQEHNDYATYGIIPMKLSFTNVTGGCGILAGWSVREAEWVTYWQNNNW